MFTNEFEFDASITTILDETGEWEDVELIIEDDVVFIRQFGKVDDKPADLIAFTPKMFTDMLEGIKYEAIQALTRVQIRSESEVEAMEQSHTDDLSMKMEHASAENPLSSEDTQEDVRQPFIRKEKKVGRNEPCWCGSGKKYKQCHGKLS